MSAQKSSINLLQKDEFEASTLGRIFKWALTVGKYIVIVTQLVVITAFIYRFKLDRDLEALNESIEQQQVEVVSYQDLERRVRILQDQLRTIKTITEKQLNAGSIFESLAQIMPKETSVELLSLSNDSLNLTGKTLTEVGLATLITGLQVQPQLSDITVSSITTGGAKDPTLSFTLTAKVQSNPTEAKE